MVPKVANIGGIDIFPIKKPFRSPQRVEQVTALIIESKIILVSPIPATGKKAPDIVSAAIIPDSPAFATIDKSIPPVLVDD